MSGHPAPPTRLRFALRIVLWWLLVVAVFLFIAVMFGGLRRQLLLS